MGDLWTGSGMWIFLGLLFIVALAVTFYIFKKEEEKMRKLEVEGDTSSDELQRSIDYESNSLKSNVPILTWIYVITILLSLIIFFIYLFKIS